MTEVRTCRYFCPEAGACIRNGVAETRRRMRNAAEAYHSNWDDLTHELLDEIPDVRVRLKAQGGTRKHQDVFLGQLSLNSREMLFIPYISDDHGRLKRGMIMECLVDGVGLSGGCLGFQPLMIEAEESFWRVMKTLCCS